MTDADEDKGEVDTITLMSVHAAKGLEFKSVFVTGLEENLFPSYQSLSTPDQIDEERRLFYVAITRAEIYLVLTYANSRYQFGQMRFNDPSRFIEEISEENIDAITGITREESRPALANPNFGNFKKPGLAVPKIDASRFKPSRRKASGRVKSAALKIWWGQVMHIDERNVATINFPSSHRFQRNQLCCSLPNCRILE